MTLYDAGTLLLRRGRMDFAGHLPLRELEGLALDRGDGHLVRAGHGSGGLVERIRPRIDRRRGLGRRLGRMRAGSGSSRFPGAAPSSVTVPVTGWRSSPSSPPPQPITPQETSSDAAIAQRRDTLRSTAIENFHGAGPSRIGGTKDATRPGAARVSGPPDDCRRGKTTGLSASKLAVRDILGQIKIDGRRRGENDQGDYKQDTDAVEHEPAPDRGADASGSRGVPPGTESLTIHVMWRHAGMIDVQIPLNLRLSYSRAPWAQSTQYDGDGRQFPA